MNKQELKTIISHYRKLWFQAPPNHVVDIQLVRRKSIWGIPLFLIIIASGIWVFIDSTIPTIYDIMNLAPSVRLGLIEFAFPLFIFCLFILLLMIVAYVFNCVNFAKFIEPAMLWSAVISLVFIFLSFTLFKPIESYYMQELGYSKCNLLDGNPTIYFQDWVKNPEWCVRGKTREWVSEQAGTQRDQ